MDSSSRQEEQKDEQFRVQILTSSQRRSSEVGSLWTELGRSTPEDEGSPEASMLEAIQRMKESEKNSRLAEVEKILKNIISMSRKYSQSEAALTVFQATSLDSVRPLRQSPITVEDIWRSNGFCLANTETILYDACLTKKNEKSRSVLSAGYSSQMSARTHKRHEDGLKCSEQPVTSNSGIRIQESSHTATRTQSYVNNLSFLKVEVCETDILE